MIIRENTAMGPIEVVEPNKPKWRVCGICPENVPHFERLPCCGVPTAETVLEFRNAVSFRNWLGLNAKVLRNKLGMSAMSHGKRLMRFVGRIIVFSISCLRLLREFGALQDLRRHLVGLRISERSSAVVTLG